MFHKILVAVDNSSQSPIVFDQALSLAKATSANLMLLHVLSSEEKGSPNISVIGLEYYPVVTEIYQKQWSEYENRSLDLLKSYAKQASEAGVMAEFTQNIGSPGRTICEFAHSWEADMIVIGRRGHSGLNELLLGSVSSYVMHHSPCSVLTVQAAAHVDSTTARSQSATAAT